MTKLNVLADPCTTCPYRLDTPPGIWHPSEYKKLSLYDDDQIMQDTKTFLCHQSTAIGRPTVCRGWLSVHCHSVAARLAARRGEITIDELYAKTDVPLYKSGKEAMIAGLKGVAKPSAKAIEKIAVLEKRLK